MPQPPQRREMQNSHTNGRKALDSRGMVECCHLQLLQSPETRTLTVRCWFDPVCLHISLLFLRQGRKVLLHYLYLLSPGPSYLQTLSVCCCCLVFVLILLLSLFCFKTRRKARSKETNIRLSKVTQSHHFHIQFWESLRKMENRTSVNENSHVCTYCVQGVKRHVPWWGRNCTNTRTRVPISVVPANARWACWPTGNPSN